MENIKSAEEILIPKGYIRVDDVEGELFERTDAIEAMQEYAAQFQPKWVEGVPDSKRDVIMLEDDGQEWRGYFNGKEFVAYGTLGVEVIAYREINTAFIPDHLKAKIK